MFGGIALLVHRVCFGVAIFWLLASSIHTLQAVEDLGWHATVAFAQIGLAPALMIAIFGRVVLFLFKRQ